MKTGNGEQDTAVEAVDYTTMSKDELFESLGQAYKAKDYKLMGRLSTLVAKAEAADLKAKKDALSAELQGLILEVKKSFDKLANQWAESGKLDGADGIWYAKDFGDTSTALKLLKSAKREGGTGTASQSSYVANPAKSADLLNQVGSEVMFAEDTTVTIDKVEQVIKAKTTYREAYDLSTNGGWRNRVRMALLKKTNII